MIIIKQVIHYTDTNSVEATWVERTITPQAEVPEVPAVLDEEGNVTTPAVPAYTPDDIVTAVQIKCHSYADVQMDMFRADVAEYGGNIAEYEALIADVESKIVLYVPPALTVQAIVDAMTALFDTTAQAKSYDNRITCTMRAGYPGPFQAEGIAFATWMDTCNATAYVMLAEVQAGTMPMPATLDAALSLLPPMIWPT